VLVDAGCEHIQILHVVVAVGSKEDLKGTPPASAAFAGLPTGAASCSGGDGVGIVPLSPV